MAVKALPSQEVLRQLLDYNPETGQLFWKARTEENCQRPKWFNSKMAGKEAFTARQRYNFGLINETSYMAHRVIWVWWHGADPGQMHIDHINCDRYDNRIENLRLADAATNQYNKPKQKGTTSKFKGVGYIAAQGKWHAWFRIGGKRIHLGTFNCQTAGALAYDRAARKYAGDHARGNGAYSDMRRINEP